MNKAQRVAAILHITDHFRADPELMWSRVEFALNSLGFDTTEHIGTEEQIDTGSDEQIRDLATAFGIELPPDGLAAAPVVNQAAAETSRPSPLFVFASHLTKHKVLVGDVSRALASYGIDLFVAHDTIDHDAAWEEAIRDALDRADAGLVFVHEGLKESTWCDQEVGWLQGRHVPVMALKFDATPYGFFAKYQAQQIPSDATAQQIAEMTVERIAGRPALSLSLAASLISALRVTNNFDDARVRWRYLRGVSGLDSKMCAQLLDAAKTNNQVYWANSPWEGDDGQNISRLIIALLRDQPGGQTVAPDIDAYEQYLDAREASGVSFYTPHTPPPATVVV